jgi:DTW domain-containing protein YfiP
MTAAVSVAAIRYRQRTVAAALHLLLIHCTSVLKCQAFSTSMRSEVLRTASASANCSRRHAIIQEGQDLGNGLECERVFPPFDNELYHFYRTNFSSKNKRLVPSLPKDGSRNNDDDSMYILRAKKQHDIVAAVRLTRSKACRDYTFLRAACVSRSYRRQGLALRILKESIADFGTSQHFYCFASPELQPLYEQAGFTSRTSNTDDLPQWLVLSFTSMATRLRGKRQTLDLFVKSSCTEEKVDPSSSSSGVYILLLQHANESRRKTATGWLLDDELFQNAMCIGDSVRDNGYSELSKYLNLKHWTWSGRGDNSLIEEQLGKLGHRAVLLWTDAGGGDESSENVHEAAKYVRREDEKTSQYTYVILDGTWQEAKAMFRKIPGLWKLPRLSLSTADTPSVYTLRKDYTGWRQRFSSGDGEDLLCTAEVAAALMDRTGDNISANEIRYRLNAFQENFQQMKFNRDTRKNQ